MWRCMHIECLSVATSQPLPPRLCFSSPTVPASSLVPRKFSSVFFSGLRPPFSVGASPCKLRRHINIHTYFAAGSRNRHGFVWRWLPPRRPARRLFCCGGITLKYLYITSVRCPFAAATASTLFFFADSACFHPCSAQVLAILFLGPPPPVSCGGIPV